MPVRKARFDPAGGVLSVAVACTPNLPGAYTVKLWGAEVNKLVKQWEGNFINTDDDSHRLPRPVKSNDGRLVQALITMAAGPCRATFTVSQGEYLLTEASADFPAGGIGLTANLFFALEAR